MSVNMTDNFSDCILYELLVYSEWKQEPELIKYSKYNGNDLFSIASSSISIKSIFNYFRRRKLNSAQISSLLLRQLPWQFAAGENGKVVAVLQDTLLEIRTSRDEYSSVVGKAVVSKDRYPQWRKLAWSPDCSMLAVAHSNGTVSFYDLLGSNLFNISPTKIQTDVSYSGNSICALACILFLPPRIKNPKWSYEMIMVDYYGNLRGYLVSPTDGFQENHTFIFSQHYPQGVWAVAHNVAHNLLFIAGTQTILTTTLMKGLGSSMGLSAWRILNDYPYYQLVLSLDEEEAIIQAQRSLWNYIPFVGGSNTKSSVFKMEISPNGKLLACIHTCGSISIWHLPGIRLYKYWCLVDQPDYNTVAPQLSEAKYNKNMNSASTLQYNPIDINWWSDEIVIIARCSGSVSVCSIASLRNLLGEFPEFFSGCPQVSALYNNQGFLSLECESLLTSRRRLLSDATYSDTENSEESSDDEISLLGRSSAIIQSAVYMITDIERFQPKRKTPKLLHKMYRLLGLRSTTPEELYSRKIDNEAYSEALSLARAYNLDCDLVYQRQWRNEKVSVNTIQDYLSKISKRSWVLNECLQRVPESFSVSRELLQFGLKETSLEVLLNLDGSSGDIFESLEDEKEEKEGIKLSQKVEMLLRKVSKNGFTEEQQGIRFRRKLLQYFDRLCTYELILGGRHVAEEQYNSNFYERFRSTPLVTSAVEFAREGKWQAVQHMFTYHGQVLLHHWLPIVSNFPETLNPFEYRSLLPECSSSGTVFLWEQSQLRQEDWCERSEFRHLLDVSENEEDADCLYEKDPTLKQFMCHSELITSDILSRWYINRISQVESRSGLVEHALTLVKLGKERNIAGLDSLYYQLLTLDTLVYEVKLEDMNLSSLQKLSDIDKARLLMSKTSESTFVEDLKSFLLPFLTRCEKIVAGSKKHLFKDYLVDLSLKGLSLPLKLFENIRDEQPNSIIPFLEDAMSLVLDCLYAYPGTDQLEEAFLILECVPERGSGEHTETLSLLHDKLDELEHNLCAAQILNRHGVSKPLSFIRDCKSNPTAVHQLLTKLTRTLVKTVPPPTERQWETLLNDVLELHTKVFSCVTLETCFEIYVSTLLSSGIKSNIRAAADVLERRKSERSLSKVPFDRSVALVLQAAVEYFDSAGSLVDPAMELSKACLHLILDEHEDIQEMLDLITSLHLLNDFKLSMLPLQVRLCTDRMRLVESCIQNKAKAYRNSQKLLHLAEKLRVCGKDSGKREEQVLMLIAQAAFEASDYTYCANICQRLIEKCYTASWEMTQKLGQCNDFNNLQVRSDLLAFSLQHCSPAVIEQIINSRLLLEAEMLHEKVRSQVTSCCVAEGNDITNGEEEYSDALTSPVSPQKEFPSVTSLLHAVGDSTEAVRQTTYSLLKHVGRQDFWKNTFRWDMEYSSDIVDDNSDPPFSKQGFPVFYASLSPKSHFSSLATKYNKFSLPTVENNVLNMCQTLLRIALLEDCVQLKEKNHSTDNTELLLQLGEHLLSEDCCLGLAYLFALNDPTKAEHCFRNLPTTSIALQLASYYYAIQGYKLLRNFNPREVYLYKPTEFIDFMVETAVKEETINVCLEELLKYRDQLADYLQGQQLMCLGCGVDLKRFTYDAEYRQDTIIGLAMTQEEEQFTLAVHLGTRYGVPLSEIAAGFASTLILNPDSVPLSDLTSRLTDPKLLDMLKTSPETVCERFLRYVYPGIDGTDHQMLVLYFTLLNLVAPDTTAHVLVPKEHLKLVKKVKAASSDIDYKKLVDPSSDTLQDLQPVLTKDNIILISKLLKTLPAALNCAVQTGSLYSMWAQKEFFQIVHKDQSQHLHSEMWLKQYEICNHHFSKMSPQDILNFVRGICFVDKSLDFLTRNVRMEIMKRTINYCEGKIKVDSNRDDWNSCVDTLELWIEHLERIIGFNLESLRDSPRYKNFKTFYRLLDLSCGEPSKAEEVIQSAVLSPIPLDYIQMLLDIAPESLPSRIEHCLKRLLKKTISEIKLDADDLKLLAAVLKRLQECLDNEQSSSSIVDDEDSSDAVWRLLEPLCADATLSPSIRLQALQLLNKLKSTSSDSNNLLIYHHTEATVAANWSSDSIKVVEKDLVSECARKELFYKLLDDTCNWSQILTLKELLCNWPPFIETTPEPLLVLAEKLVHFPELDIKSGAAVLKSIFQENKFPEQSVMRLISSIESSVDPTMSIFLCLISGYKNLFLKAVSLIKNHHRKIEGPLEEEILTLILLSGLTAQVVETPVYGQLVEHLLSGEGNHLPSVETISEQLFSAGCEAEAGTLRLLHMGVPASLTLFSAAVAYCHSFVKQ